MADAPRAQRIPVTHTLHGTTRVDPYSWLRERVNPAVHAYLAAENAYAAEQIDPTLQAQLTNELVSRLAVTDESAPQRIGTYSYQFRLAAGAQYPVLVRWPSADPAHVAVVIDVAAEATGHTFCKLGSWRVSPDGALVAFLIDNNGSERFRLHIRRIADGSPCITPVDDLYYGLEWSPDSQVIYAVRPDEAWRPSEVIAWRFGDRNQPAQRIYHEPDERFNVDLAASGDGLHLLIGSYSAQTSEVWLYDAQSALSVGCIAPRDAGVEYSVAMAGTRVYRLTNHGATNFTLFSKLLDQTEWTHIVPERSDTLIEHITVLVDYVVLWIRRGGLPGIEYLAHGSTTLQALTFPDAAYSLSDTDSHEYAANVLVYAYATPVMPTVTSAIDLASGSVDVRKREALGCAHRPEEYLVERVHVTARDGAQIPLTIVAHRSIARDGTAPALQIGYGAYGANLNVGFVIERLSLLERGVVLAFAHIRGGGEGGRSWYLDGKLAQKQHTFDDFIDCTQYLIDQRYTSAARLACYGRSAGGLLVGAVVTQRPELYAAAIALVPFVDVINTMCDPTIPLTVPEYEEWGNPTIPAEAAVMQRYSPYDHTVAQRYPALLLTAGFQDPRVSYWEPAKWIAALRHAAPAGTYYLVTDMHAGHAGKSGRTALMADRAIEYTFLCQHLALPHLPLLQEERT